MSKNYLKYRKYVGTVQFDADDRIFHGHVLGINDSISFEGSSVEELEQDFKAAIENYLETCRKLGKSRKNLSREPSTFALIRLFMKCLLPAHFKKVRH